MNKYNNESTGKTGWRSFQQMIEQYHMLEHCEHVLVGLSGGADSVCLLLMLRDYIAGHNLPITLHAMHVNHGIRGIEADADEAFCQQLCEKLQVPLDCVQVDIPKMAKERKETEEEAGRNVRYNIFQKKAKELGMTKIAVAHHMNDQAETVMMNLLRGSSLKGMCGMLPVRDNVIRPMLSMTRQEVEAYLSEHGQAFVTDATNSDSAYTRNRMRQEVIPYLEQQGSPQAVRRIAELADSMQEISAYMKKQTHKAYKRCVTRATQGEGLLLNGETFLQLDAVIGKNVIYDAMVSLSGREKDIYRTHVAEVFDLFSQQVQKGVDLPYGLRAVRTYEGVFLGKAETVQDMEDGQAGMPEEDTFSIEVGALIASLEVGVPVRVPVEQMIYMGKEGMIFISNVVLELQENVDFSENNDYTKVFDYDKMKDNLIFRFRSAGDRIMVTAQGQTRKLKKEFIDRKIDREARERILLLAADHMVYWAAGVRRSEDCLVEPTTENILRVTLE